MMKPHAADELNHGQDWDHEDPDLKESVVKEIEALGSLKQNWDQYGAPPIDGDIIRAAAEFIRSLPDCLATRPRVVPMSPGNLQFEWHHGRRILELEFETAEVIRFLQWNADEDFSEEDTFHVGDIERAAELIRWFTGGIAA